MEIEERDFYDALRLIHNSVLFMAESEFKYGVQEWLNRMLDKYDSGSVWKDEG